MRNVVYAGIYAVLFGTTCHLAWQVVKLEAEKDDIVREAIMVHLSDRETMRRAAEEWAKATDRHKCGIVYPNEL